MNNIINWKIISHMHRLVRNSSKMGFEPLLTFECCPALTSGPISMALMWNLSSWYDTQLGTPLIPILRLGPPQNALIVVFQFVNTEALHKNGDFVKNKTYFVNRFQKSKCIRNIFWCRFHWKKLDQCFFF